MKNNNNLLKTELVFILDRSGSMCGLEKDTIGGFNSMLNKQKKEEGEAYITTVLFDDNFDVLHNRIAIKDVNNLTEKDYYVRGTTALLDAIGKTINKVKHTQKLLPEKDKADKVIFVITTDGMENASCEFSSNKIKKLVTEQQEFFDWEFIFLGANIDAINTAKAFGIHEDRAVDFCCDSEGVQLNYEVLDETISNLRCNREVDSTWKSKIEEYYKENC